MGTEPIEAIDLVKNGEVVYTKRYLSGSIGPRVRVKVAYSSLRGNVKGPYRGAGRGAQEWQTTVEVRNGRVAGFDRPWYFNPNTYRVGRDPGNPNRLTFDVQTAGREQALILDLEQTGPSTEIVVDTGRGESNFMFRLDELTTGPKNYEIPVGDVADTVLAALVPDEGALDQEFLYADTGDVEEGDYYYVRVRQVDGSVAWSSPFWTDAD
jgi:hypothetical protein